MDPRDIFENQSTLSPEEPKLLAQINGSPLKALSFNTAVWFGSFMTVVGVSPIVNTLSGLDASSKLLLIAMPAIPGSIFQSYMGYRINLTGGMTLIKVLRCLSLAGSVGLVILSANSDLSSIQAKDDRRYIALCFLGLLSGSSGPLFQLIVNVSQWVTKKNAAHYRTSFAGLGGIAPGLGLIASNFIRKSFGLTASLGLFLGISTLSTVFTLLGLRESPYHQLKRYLTHDSAKAIAMQYGQSVFPPAFSKGYWQTLKDTLCHPCTPVLILGVGVSFGGVIYLSTSLYQILLGISNLSTDSAILAAGFGSIGSTLVRAATGKLIQRFDPSKGVYTFCASVALSAVGELVLAISRPPSLKAVIAAEALIFGGCGVGVSAIFEILGIWSAGYEVQGTRFRPYNLGMMSGIVSNGGMAGSVIFPLLNAWLLSLLDDTNGYATMFLILAVLSLISIPATLCMDRAIRKPPIAPQAGFFSASIEEVPAEVVVPDVHHAAYPGYRESIV